MDRIAETITVYESMDYEMPKQVKTNRVINEAHVQVLMESIQKRNLLKVRPLLLSGHNYLIDGQHRLEACKKLGIPFLFTRSEDVTLGDVTTLNVGAKSWSRNDFFRHYCESGKQEYLKLRDFCIQYNIGLDEAIPVFTRSLWTQALPILNKGVNSKNAPKAMEGFADGLYVYPMDDSQYHHFMKCFLEIKRIGSLPKHPIGKPTLLTLIKAHRTTGFDMERMVQKFRTYPNIYVETRDSVHRLRQMEDLYNRNERETNQIRFKRAA